jgi:hypothetical protein
MTNKVKFLKELKDLLEKYDIIVEVDITEDTYGHYCGHTITADNFYARNAEYFSVNLGREFDAQDLEKEIEKSS